MIAVDTSALMAILLREDRAEDCRTALVEADRLVISAAPFVEAGIVSARRKVGEEMARLVSGLEMKIASVSPATAARAVQAHRRWGRGVHPASLNFGACFSYALAEEQGCPLLFVGDDFSRTDVRSAI